MHQFDCNGFIKLYRSLSLFVHNICENRDESHGHAHMCAVYNRAVQIFDGEYDRLINTPFNISEIFKDIMIVSWLHDVADHKYDYDNNIRDRLLKYLESISNTPILLVNIIDRISYSKEVKNIKLDWNEVIGEYGCIIRNIVSDADKLEALGKSGYDRCIEYRKEDYFKKYSLEIPQNLLYDDVKKHAHEKLLRLKDHFIRTETGKKMAIKLHDEFYELIKKL